VTKQARGDTIVEAIRRIFSGEVYVSQEASQQILETLVTTKKTPESTSVRELSDREFEVFQLTGQGLSSGQIAHRMHLSIKTVQAHCSNIKAKLKLKTARQLISYAASWMAHEATGGSR